MSLFDAVSSSLSNMVIGSVSQAVSGLIPNSVNNVINNAKSIGNQLSNNAANSLLNSNSSDSRGLSSGESKTQSDFWGTETPMFANVSPSEAKAIYRKSQAVTLAQKNWWVIEVSSPLQGDISESFNLLASDVEYSPSTVTAEKRKVGGATVDSVQSSEPTDLSITIMDNADGFLKNWFNSHVFAAAHTDGTIGYPSDYAIKIKITHGFPTGNYQDLGLFRPTNMSVSLSRKEAAVQELTMTFSQLDSFMKP